LEPEDSNWRKRNTFMPTTCACCCRPLGIVQQNQIKRARKLQEDAKSEHEKLVAGVLWACTAYVAASFCPFGNSTRVGPIFGALLGQPPSTGQVVQRVVGGCMCNAWTVCFAVTVCSALHCLACCAQGMLGACGAQQQQSSRATTQPSR
jgi:hypothetical protein